MGQRRRGRGRRRVAGFGPGERRAHPASQRRNGRARRYWRQQRRFPARLTTSTDADAQSDINACCHCGTDTDADRFSHTERATIGAQVARIKDFESVREFFTGPLATVFMELPFALFYFTVIALLGGIIALVPVISTARWFL